MLFYDSIGPNPKVVRMFMAERGISGIPTETIDLRGGENRKEPFLSRIPPVNVRRWRWTMAPSFPRSPRSANISMRPGPLA